VLPADVRHDTPNASTAFPYFIEEDEGGIEGVWRK
jgi:hypothetical protein